MTSDHPIKTTDLKPPGAQPIQDTVELRGNLGLGESTFTTFSDELESIYRYAPVGLCVLDTELHFRRINLRLAEINGIPVEDHIGRTVREIVPHLADQADKILKRILETGEPLLDVEVTGITAAQPDTIRSWIESWLPLKRDDGTIIGINVVAQEITARKQAEAALRVNERRLSLAISATADAIWEWNLATSQTYYSPRWYEMLGYGVDEIPMDYDGWKRLCHPDDLQPTMDVIRSSLKSDNFYAAEFRMRSKDGGWRWILGRGRVVERDAAGEPLLLSGTNTDITERKTSEEALHESEIRFRALVEASSEVLYRMNPDWTQMHHLRSNGFLADTLKPSSTWIDEYIHPDDQPRVKAAIDEAIRQKSVFELTHRVRRADGSLGWTFSRAVPLLDSQGEITEWFGAASDITESKRAEDALRTSESRLVEAQRIAKVGDWEWDLTTGNIFWSPSMYVLFGRRPELGPSSYSEHARYYPGDGWTRLEKVVKNTIESGEPYEIELEHIREDDTRGWHIAKGEAVRDLAGRTVKLRGTAQDITERKEAEEALRRSEARLSSALEIAQLGVWDYDPVARVNRSDRRCREIFGIDEDRLIPQSEILEMIHPDDRERVDGQILAAFGEEGGGAFDMEYRILRGDGRQIWVAVRGSAVISDGAGERGPSHYIGTVMDITERKRAEEALRRISQFPEENPNPVMRVAADGTVLYENTAMQELRAALEWGSGNPMPVALIAVVADAIEKGHAVETEIAAPNGKTFGFFAIQPRGETYINLYGMNVSERKKAEEALRESEARLSAILNELPIGVGVYDSAGRPILLNDLMRNYTPEAMPSRDPEGRQRWHALDSAGVPIPPDKWPGARALRGESVIPGMEFSYTDYTGREFWMMVSAVPFSGLKGGEIGAIGVVQDITELKQAERTLVETNQELSEYTYAVVHNLKAPFRAVQNYANFLWEDAADVLAGEPKQFLDGIKKAVRFAGQQFSDLDALYLIRKHTVDIEPVEMHTLLGEFVAMYPHGADGRVVISETWPLLRTDGFLLRQIIMALIDNGLKYNQSTVKRVDIGWQENAERIEISVRDNGIGIDPQYHEHIFHIFKRLHTEEEYEGTGIGLAIARRAVQKIGGELRIESALGEGSTFVISLPAAMVESAGEHHH